MFDRASTAVTSALEIQARLHDHPYLKVRVGMDMGQVKEITPINFSGSAIDYASRVMGMADGGHILVTEPINRSASGKICRAMASWKRHSFYKKKESDRELELYEPYNANITQPMDVLKGIEIFPHKTPKEEPPEGPPAPLPKREGESPQNGKSQIRSEDYLLGSLDAWADTAGLLENFIPVKEFGELFEKEKYFLCGRRGAGKSALAIKLEETTKVSGDYCSVIQGERQAYGEFTSLVEILKTGGLKPSEIKDFVYYLWRYILHILIMQIVLKYHREISEETKIIRGYLTGVDLLTADISDILYKVFKATEIERDKALINAFYNLRSKYQTSEYREALDQIPKILKTKTVLIALDTLESYRIYNIYNRSIIKGIVKAILEVSRDTNFQGNVHIRFFIPAEIYEDIASEIPAKIGGGTIFLRWQFSDLIAMLSKRFLEMLRRTESVNGSVIRELDKLVNEALQGGPGKKRELRRSFWYAHGFLPPTIHNYNNVEEDCFAYLLRHTQRRPRELILILNQIILKAWENNELPEISEYSVREGLHARHTTVNILLRDTLAPYREYISDITDIVTDMVRSVFVERPRVMSGTELKQFAKALYDVHPTEEIDPEQFIRLLLRAGLIGQIIDPKRGADKVSGYCEAYFEYLMQDHIPLNNTLTYYVHPMLGDFLRMKRVPGYGTVYPLPDNDLHLEEEIGGVRFYQMSTRMK